MEIKSLTTLDDIYPLSIPSTHYSFSNIEYKKHYMYEWNFEDLSFGVFHNEQCLAFVLLTKGIGPDGKVAFDWFGFPAISVEIDNLPKEAHSLIRNRLKKILDNDVTFMSNYKEYVRLGGLTCMATFLLDVGYKCKNTFEMRVDLSFSEKVLWENIRKRYKPLINKALKNIRYDLISSDNVSTGIFDTFRSFHEKIAGRATRNKESWEQQYQKVLANKAFCFMAYEKKELVGVSFYSKEATSCIYGVGAYARDRFVELPIAHGAMWKAILHAKDCNCKFFEIGKTFFPFQQQDISEKENSIGFFKRGFSKNIIPILYLHY